MNGLSIGQNSRRGSVLIWAIAPVDTNGLKMGATGWQHLFQCLRAFKPIRATLFIFALMIFACVDWIPGYANGLPGWIPFPVYKTVKQKAVAELGEVQLLEDVLILDNSRGNNPCLEQSGSRDEIERTSANMRMGCNYAPQKLRFIDMVEGPLWFRTYFERIDHFEKSCRSVTGIFDNRGEQPRCMTGLFPAVVDHLEGSRSNISAVAYNLLSLAISACAVAA